MRKAITTILAVGFISSMLISSAYAGDRHMSVLNPLWLPAVILSTAAATVAIAAQPPVIYEQRVYSEPQQSVIYEVLRQAVIYEEPRHYRHDYYYDREPAGYRYVERERVYESPCYRNYR